MPYSNIKLSKEQMVSTQDQATNNYKNETQAHPPLDDQLNNRMRAGKNQKKYSPKHDSYNRIRNPQTNRYVNIDSTQGRFILRNYLEHYSNLRSDRIG